MFKKISLFIVISLLILGCETVKNTKPVVLDFDHYFLKAQDLSNRGKYLKAIDALHETEKKFPNVEVLSIAYNLGYNYYRLNRIPEAKQQFNKVITIFESNTFSDAYVQENRKFVVLSGIILDKIEKEKEQAKDPYHIQEDLSNSKTIKPRKNFKPKIIR